MWATYELSLESPILGRYSRETLLFSFRSSSVASQLLVLCEIFPRSFPFLGNAIVHQTPVSPTCELDPHRLGSSKNESRGPARGIRCSDDRDGAHARDCLPLNRNSIFNPPEVPLLENDCLLRVWCVWCMSDCI